MGDLEGFEWDAANVSHILRHGVMPAEVEEVVTRPNVAFVNSIWALPHFWCNPQRLQHIVDKMF